MNNMIEDLSKLTTIPTDALSKLVQKSEWIICDTICGSTGNIFEIDIGLGKLLISNELEYVRYKFIPSESLDASIRKTLDTKINPLQDQLEKRLINKIIHTYKDIL